LFKFQRLSSAEYVSVAAVNPSSVVPIVKPPPSLKIAVLALGAKFKFRSAIVTVVELTVVVVP